MKEVINVITTTDDGVVKVRNYNPENVENAEDKFRTLVRELNTGVDDDEVDEALENGIYEYNGCAVYIQWNEIH